MAGTKDKEALDAMLSKACEGKSQSPRPMPLLHYGHYAVKRVWEQELNLDRVFLELQKEKTGIKSYSLNKIALYLTALKILDPWGSLDAYDGQYALAGGLIEGVLPENLYRALEFFGQNQDRILGEAYRHSRGEGFRPPLNFCALSEGRLTAFSYENDHELDLRFERIDKMLDKAADLEDLERLRDKMHELSCEEKNNPAALCFDEQGLLFDVCLCKDLDFDKLVSDLASVRQKHEVPRLFFICDGPFGSVSQRHALVKAGLDFVMPGMPQYRGRVKKFLEDKSDWQEFKPGPYDDPLRFKSMPFKYSELVTEPDGSQHSVAFNTRMLFLLNPVKEERDLRFLKNSRVKSRASELKRCQAMAGCSSFLYTAPGAAEDFQAFDRSLLQALHTVNRNRVWFKVMHQRYFLPEDELWQDPRFKGHTLICALALMILCLIKDRLGEKGKLISFHDISAALYGAAVTAVIEDDKTVLLRSGGHDFIQKYSPAPDNVFDADDISQLQELLDEIFEAFGLKGLPSACALEVAGSYLGAKFGSLEDLLGVVLTKIATAPPAHSH